MRNNTDNNLSNNFEIFLYNAMTFENIRVFAKKALDDFTERLGGKNITAGSKNSKYN